MAEMKNQYRFIARIVIETKAPLTISSGNKSIKTDSLVLRDVNGLPFIPGTTIAGLLRHSLDKKEQDLLMGSQKEGSRLIITDARMLNENGGVLDGMLPENQLNTNFLSHFRKQMTIRQHVRINHKGTAEKHGKFDEEVVLKGARFCFEMEMISNDADDSKFKAILNTFASDTFRIGSGSRSGFGEIEVVGNGEVIGNKTIDGKCLYKMIDLSISEQKKWYLSKSSSLNEEWNDCEEYHLERPKLEGWTKYEIKGLTPVDFILFGSGFGNDQSDITFVRESFVKWENGKATVIDGSKIEESIEKVNVVLIPASSVKGALAHRVAYHYNKKVGNVFMSDGTLGNGKSAESVTGKNNPAVKAIFGSEGKKNEDTKKMEEKQRGNFLMSDVVKEKENSTRQKILNHVSIDRFTGGAIDGALFSEETLLANKECFEFTIMVNNQAFRNNVDGEEKIEGKDIIDAFESALYDVCAGMLPLGGGVNRGNGCFELSGTGEFKKEIDGITYKYNMEEKKWEELELTK